MAWYNGTSNQPDDLICHLYEFVAKWCKMGNAPIYSNRGAYSRTLERRLLLHLLLGDMGSKGATHCPRAQFTGAEFSQCVATCCNIYLHEEYKKKKKSKKHEEELLRKVQVDCSGFQLPLNDLGCEFRSTRKNGMKRSREQQSNQFLSSFHCFQQAFWMVFMDCMVKTGWFSAFLLGQSEWLVSFHWPTFLHGHSRNQRRRKRKRKAAMTSGSQGEGRRSLWNFHEFPPTNGESMLASEFSGNWFEDVLKFGSCIDVDSYIPSGELT